MPELIFKDEVFAIVGSAMTVYNELGRGFLEPVYHEALEIELRRNGIPFTSQGRIQVIYKNVPLRQYYVPDLLCYDQIIVELKVLERLTGVEHSQVINYLKATKHRVGLLINFGSLGRMEWQRFII